MLTAPRLALGALLAVSPLAATNQLSNPNFNGGISPWESAGEGTAAFDALDLYGAGGSGSVLIEDAPGNSFVAALRQCVTVTAGQRYFLSGKVLIPAGQGSPSGPGSSGFVKLAVAFRAAADCPAPGGNLESPAADLSKTGRWQSLGESFVAPDGSHSALVVLMVYGGGAGAFRAHFDQVAFGPGCTADTDTLCVNNARFRVEAQWKTGDGQQGFGRAVQLTPDTGYFWFFALANVEAVVKVLDGCGLGGKYWVFAGGLTNVEASIVVTDTVSGLSKSYTNPQGKAFQPIQDTAALAVCP